MNVKSRMTALCISVLCWVSIQGQETTTTRNLVPKMAVSVVEGQNLYLRFDDEVVSNLEECRVNWTQREVILKPGRNDDLLVTYWGAGLEKDCGVRASGVKAEDTGIWILRARNSTGHELEGTFNISVVGKSVPDKTDKVFIEGDYAELSLGANTSLYCQSQPPGGKWSAPKTNVCDVKLPKITKGDGGEWIAKYAIPGFVEEMQTKISVQVKDRNYIQTSLKPSTRHPGGLDLLCRGTTYEYSSMQTVYCRFIRPDGVTLSLQDGIGNANYSYYGDGINFSNAIKDCGVTIHNPKQIDVGPWQCLIGMNYQNMIKGGFIHVQSTAGAIKNNLVRESETEITVKNQQPLVLSCKAATSLNYCWFGHPNGTTLAVYSPTTTTSRDSPFSYQGQGLDLGDCTIMVKEATHNDKGIWSCNMGISESADLRVLIDIRVVEGNMAAEVPMVSLSGNAPPTLKCHTIPKGVSLEYCRFIRPDGVGFGFKNLKEVVLHRYSYHGDGLERGECGLKIETVNEVDFGRWTCAALHVAETVEGSIHISLEDQRGLTGGAITGIVFAVLIAIVLLGVLAVYILRRHRSQYR